MDGGNQNIYSSAAFLYHDMFNFSIIPERSKKPLVEWDSFKSGQTLEQLQALSFNSTCNGIGVILNNNLRCFDIDKCKNEDVLNNIIFSLGFPAAYKWIVKTGNGYHIYFYCDESEYFYKQYGKKSNYTFKLKSGYILELKWKDCKCTLPPSEHDNGSLYAFVNVEPNQPPGQIRDLSILFKTINEFCIAEDKKTANEKSQYLIRTIEKGQRHNSLVSYAGMLKSKGINKNTAFNLLNSWNKTNFNPPLPDNELITTVEDIYKRYNKQEVKLVSAEGIQAMTIKPINWIVKGLIPEGLGILAGRPKIGKSWLALDISLAVSLGGLALGKFQANQFSIFYIPYEDNYRRLQDRINNILATESLSKAPSNLFYPQDCNFPKMNQEGIDLLERILNKDENIKLVVIDTLGRAIERPNKRNNNIFQDEYDFSAKLQRIAIARNISILLVHHTSKAKYEDVFDQVLGTTGLTASPDLLMMLYKDSSKYKLSITGRDIVSNDYEMKFDKCIWFVCEESEKKLTPERKMIVEFLKDIDEPQSTSSIAAALGKNEKSISNLLNKLAEDGILFNSEYGKYTYRSDGSSGSII